MYTADEFIRDARALTESTAYERAAAAHAAAQPICPLSLASSRPEMQPCLGARCAWWNADFGACALAALAQAHTRPIVLAEANH